MGGLLQNCTRKPKYVRIRRTQRQFCNVRSKANTPVTLRLRPYCDQFLDQVAADRSVVVIGRTGRHTVAGRR